MSAPLAIFSPHLGALSETFIRRHAQDLLPGGTVIVTRTLDGSYLGNWTVEVPMIVLDRIPQRVEPNGLRQHMVWSIAHRLGRQTPNCLPDYLTVVKQFLKDNNVQVILSEYLDHSLHWLPVAKELGIRFFGHAHGYDISERLCDPKWRIEYPKYNGAGGVITVSHVSRERLIKLGLEAAKVHLIPYGVDVPAEPMRRTEQETVRCLVVGRMVAKKAPILTLDAFRRAAEVCPGLRLDYVGTGELLSAVRQFLLAFNMDHRVTLHGGQPSEMVARLMKQSDIFLQHSMTDPETGDGEGLPVAILEAMAEGLPVISTRHAGIPEAVLDGETGCLVEEGDSIGMAERIIHLVRNPGLRFRLGRTGWQRAKVHFSWEKERSQLLKVLGLNVGSE